MRMFFFFFWLAEKWISRLTFSKLLPASLQRPPSLQWTAVKTYWKAWREAFFHCHSCSGRGGGREWYLMWKNAGRDIRRFHTHQTFIFLAPSDVILLIWLSECEVIFSDPVWFMTVLGSRVLDVIVLQSPTCIRRAGLLLSPALLLKSPWSSPLNLRNAVGFCLPRAENRWQDVCRSRKSWANKG